MKKNLTAAQSNFNFLGLKRALNLNKKENSEIEKIQKSNLNCKFKLKENRKIQKRKNRRNIFSINQVSDRPKAPHNTNEFLIENYLIEKLNFRIGFCEIEESDFDEICLTGGTMKGIREINSLSGFNQNYLENETEESTETSEKDHFFGQRDSSIVDFQLLEQMKQSMENFGYLDKDWP